MLLNVGVSYRFIVTTSFRYHIRVSLTAFYVCPVCIFIVLLSMLSVCTFIILLGTGFVFPYLIPTLDAPLLQLSIESSFTIATVRGRPYAKGEYSLLFIFLRYVVNISHSYMIPIIYVHVRRISVVMTAIVSLCSVDFLC